MLFAQQDALRTSPNDTSASHAQSPEVASNPCDTEVDKTVKRLTEKLSAALLNISAKEELVKQHARVAEEAVSGNLLLYLNQMSKCEDSQPMHIVAMTWIHDFL